METIFAKTAVKPGVFETSHPNEPIIVPQAAYDSAYNASFPGDAASQYVQIGDASKTFTPVNSSTPISILHNLPGGMICYGNPAKSIKPRPHSD